MASLFTAPQFDAGHGIKPADGALLYFYEEGTNEPKDTFTDEALTIPNSNPVVSDANGVFAEIWMAEGDRYKAELKDKNDVLAGFGVVALYIAGITTVADFPGTAFGLELIESTNAEEARILLELNREIKNLLWQGSMNVWQRGFAFDDFTTRVGVMDGWTFSRDVASDKQILIIQQTEEARLQRIVGDSSLSKCYLVANMDHEATRDIAGKSVFIKTSLRSNDATGPVKIRVQYTTYSDLQKITALDGIYPVAHVEIITETISPTQNTGIFEDFDTIVSIPSDAMQVAIVLIYEPAGTATSNEFVEFKGVSITDIAFDSLLLVPFDLAIREAQRQYIKSYAYDSFPRSISDFGALAATSKGTATLTDSIFPENFDVSMLYAPTITIRRTNGGGFGVEFYNETQQAEVVALVNFISSKGFRLESVVKAVAYEDGSFIPTLGSVAVSYTKQDGRFVRDGDIVSFEIDIEYNTLDLTDTSDIQITGLPFGGADNDGAGDLTLNLNASTGFNLLDTDVIYPIILSTEGTLVAFTRSSGTNYDYNDGKMNASGRILISGNYKTSEIYAMNTYSSHYEAEARL